MSGVYSDGYRRCRVAAVVNESEAIRSFVLEAVDGGALGAFVPGQFVAVRSETVADGVLLRHYSLSGDPRDTMRWRISVKREPAPAGRSDVRPGRMSNHLHATLQVGVCIDVKGPAGAFVLDETSERPVVLLSGGVGVTPMMAMLHRLAARAGRRAFFVHACENGDVHAFRDEVGRLAGSREGIDVHHCYREPREHDVAQQRFNSSGFITRDTLQRLLPLDDYDVYLCGPSAFMQAQWRTLRGLGIARERIHYEFFGPATVLETADEPALATSTDTPEPAPASPAEPASVTFEPSGERHAWDASCASLLEFCENVGFAPPFSCRAGICGTCSTPLAAGEVAYNDDPLDPPPPGEVLLCCARPVGAITLQLTRGA